MPKVLKIVLAVIGGVLVLVIGAVVVAAMLFDPNDYRGKITETVKKETGRDLAIGDIKLSVFPWLNVRLADVSFSNAPGFGTTPMAQVKEAAVGVQLMPLLLDRQVQVSTIKLDGLKLDLAKDASGKTNWDDLIKAKDETAKPEADKKENGFKVESIDIAGVTLTDAYITYRDAQSGQGYRLEKVNLETGALRPGEATDIEASLSAFADAQKMSGELKFSATVLADMVAQKATAEKLKLEIKAKGDGLSADARLSGNVVADLATQVINVDKLELDFQTVMKDLSADGKLSGKVQADMAQQRINMDGLKLDFHAKNKELEAKGTLATHLKALLQAKQYELASLTLDVDATGAAIPGGKQNVKLSGSAAYDGVKGSMRFNDGKIAAAGLNIATSITGEGLSGDSPRLSGPLSIAAFNPRTLLKTLQIEDIKTSDPKVLSSASLSTRYSGSFKSARFDDLKLKLDDTNVAGNFAVRDFTSQALEFALKLDRIDADRYMAPEAPKATAPTATASSRKDINATEIPLEALDKLNASGTLDVIELKLKGATLRDVRLKVDGPKGSPKIVKLDASAYGGQIATSTRVVPGAKPGYTVNTSLTTMQLAPLLQNFAGKDYVSGLGNIKFDLTSAGKTVGDVRQALNGDLSLSFQNGAVKGFNLGQIIRQGQSMLKGEKLATTEPQQTDFTAITFAATIVNGILKSDQLNAQSPLFRLAGNGEIDLVSETLNYLVAPTVVATSKGQGGKGLEELAGLTIPIKLTGSLYAPKYKLDLQTALKQKAGDELRGKVAEKLMGTKNGAPVTDAQLKEKAGEKLNKEIGRGLEKLFGGKKKKEEPAAVPAPEAATPAPAAPAAEEAPAAAEPAP